ncbi:dipeptide/oligopeptide/nickel ABC transporter permease/ATP-binding protein [Streptomyces sp. NPDC050738]|uniref:dipeptide/oligopeptide/nickel ABC transporter permease/ATP-binding protein n=1 Tax=Streptomyces sp. NPDC050738 TaxID=3154744 RepID=UPI00343FEA71
MRRTLRSPVLIAGIVLLGGLLLLAVVGPFIWGDAADTLTGNAHQSASAAHWFGTDALGRDVFARTMAATRPTLVMTLAATAVAAVGGIGFGAVIWVAGPRTRELGQRLIDVMISYPSVLFALIVAAVLGPGATTSVAAIGLATCPAFARLTTNLAASVAGRDFVATARLLGVSPLRLLRRHLLPNIAEPLLVLLSVAFTASLKALSGLSFLGLGADFDWGRLLASGLEGIYVNPAPALGPAAAIVVAGLAGGLIGDGLAAAANPGQEHRPRGERAKIRAVLKPVQPPTPDTFAEARQLSVTLPDGTVLVDDVSLQVGRGEIVGIVGESGSGKSLTAMSLAKLLPDGLTADASTLRVGDLDLTGDPEPARLAREIGIVYQDPSASFNPTLRVGSQLTEVLRVHEGIPRKEADRRAVEQLRLAHLTVPEQRMKQHPHELSGGMRQRAMIAAALLTRPRLIIADEPTTALDVTVQDEVLKLIQEANRRDGLSVLLISHDMGVVSTVCDRVLVMYAGRLVEELPVADLREGKAQHPYTQALLAATPSIDSDRPLAAIPGRPPQPAERPSGCAFAPRCPLARAQCTEERPVLRTEGPRVACHAIDWEPAHA